MYFLSSQVPVLRHKSFLETMVFGLWRWLWLLFFLRNHHQKMFIFKSMYVSIVSLSLCLIRLTTLKTVSDYGTWSIVFVVNTQKENWWSQSLSLVLTKVLSRDDLMMPSFKFQCSSKSKLCWLTWSLFSLACVNRLFSQIIIVNVNQWDIAACKSPSLFITAWIIINTTFYRFELKVEREE